jgi:Uma2 family endonuclease
VTRLPAPRTFNVDEYYRMAAAGILTEDDRVELIEGQIVQMSPIGSRHAACVRRLTQEFHERLDRLAQILVQDPVRLGRRSEPEPDLALVKPRPDLYAAAHPGPSDVLLIIEVADSSARYDRTTKARLYARNAIPEFWLVDLTRDHVEVFRDPAPRGYRTVQVYRRGERLAPLAFPQLDLAVEAILGESLPPVKARPANAELLLRQRPTRRAARVAGRIVAQLDRDPPQRSIEGERNLVGVANWRATIAADPHPTGQADYRPGLRNLGRGDAPAVDEQ